MTERDRNGPAWATRPDPRPDARVRLVCFPHAGGGAAAFRGWTVELPETVELVAVRLPGRESRFGEPAIADWPTLLDSLDTALQEVVARPYVLLGHSLGAMIAYEVACRMTALGSPPLGLVLVGCRAPHLPMLVPAIHDLEGDDFVAQLGRFAGTDPRVLADPRLLKLLAPMLRADLALAETWPPGPSVPVEVPLTTFSGRDDPMAPPATVAAWSGYARDRFTAHQLDGDHFSLLAQPSRLLGPMRADIDAWSSPP